MAKSRKRKQFVIHTLEKAHYTYVVSGDANDTPESIQRKYESLNLRDSESFKVDGPIKGYLISSWVDCVEQK